MEDMKKWQEADETNRSVICIATDHKGESMDSFNALYGLSLPLAIAIAGVMEKNETFKRLIKSGTFAFENPLARALLENAMAESIEPNKKTGSTFVDLFKNLFS